MTAITTMDDFLALDIDKVVPGTGNAVAVHKHSYDQLTAHRNLRTYSTVEVLHACPRKFAIQKMQSHLGTRVRRQNATFAFGHAVGAGVATFDETGDLQASVWAAFLAWDVDLFETERKEGHKNGKSFVEAVWALYVYRTFREEELQELQEYEHVGSEKTVAIDFEDGSFYSGHIDELFRHRVTGQFLIKENKTTNFTNVNPALYSNSDQALSYGVIVDAEGGGSEYSVLYTIYSATQQKWVKYEFVKQTYKKADWLQDQLLINQQVDHYAELCFFPKRGGSCFDFMRVCEYYETCDTSFAAAFGMEFAELPTIKSLDDIHAIEPIDYRATMSQIVARQREKAGKESGSPSRAAQAAALSNANFGEML